MLSPKLSVGAPMRSSIASQRLLTGVSRGQLVVALGDSDHPVLLLAPLAAEHAGDDAGHVGLERQNPGGSDAWGLSGGNAPAEPSTTARTRVPNCRGREFTVSDPRQVRVPVVPRCSGVRVHC